MLLEGQQEHGILLSSSFMVGDRASDIEAGRAAGCSTILLRAPTDSEPSSADHEIRALAELLDIIV
jgi:D-glycero-D-manno-heptose 1,7-bisphosphate phosphatase